MSDEVQQFWGVASGRLLDELQAAPGGLSSAEAAKRLLYLVSTEVTKWVFYRVTGS